MQVGKMSPQKGVSAPALYSLFKGDLVPPSRGPRLPPPIWGLLYKEKQDFYF